MPYDQASFLAGVAAGRNMESWPADDGVEIFKCTVQVTDLSSTFYSPYIMFRGTIYWGDGTKTEWDSLPDDDDPYPYARSRVPHTYSRVGLYQITLKGILREFATNPTDWPTGSYPALISIDTPFPRSMYGHATSQGKEHYWLVGTFTGASNLVSVPEGLFSRCGVERLEYTFRHCTSLVDIPEKLFYGCDNLETTTALFYNCTGITDIPPGLFAGMPNVLSLRNCFYRCSGITYVPPGLLDPLEKLQDVNSMFPQNPRGEERLGLYEVPYDLFSNCPDIQDFAGCFYKNNNMSHNPPPLWDMYPDAVGTNCFYGCDYIPDYNWIPYEWGGPREE